MKNELEKIGADYSADLEAKGMEIQKLQNELKKTIFIRENLFGRN